MTDRALNYHELKKKTGLARSTVFTLEKDGKFPKRRKFGKSGTRWIESEVDAWIAGLVVDDLSAKTEAA